MSKMKDVKLLIAEDDEEMCEELSEILRGEGYSVKTVNSGAEAEKLITDDSYDVVLLDLKLPGIKGYEVLNYIRENRLKVKVIILTGSPVTGSIEGLSSTGKKDNTAENNAYKLNTLKLADAVIPKPFDVERVIEILDELTQKIS